VEENMGLNPAKRSEEENGLRIMLLFVMELKQTPSF
jgi:hypothetical protein